MGNGSAKAKTALGADAPELRRLSQLPLGARASIRHRGRLAGTTFPVEADAATGDGGNADQPTGVPCPKSRSTISGGTPKRTGAMEQPRPPETTRCAGRPSARGSTTWP